ncbi:FAD:protein FMN transferase [Kitasatospora purpeofusca]|uniref:FAD:protein FMN transferase n=1 Tax=Kitasatospora purpeofusca TaxID=67352 RepID=UPI002E10050D
MTAGTADRLRHAEHVMGTVFSVTVRDPGPRTGPALERAVARLHEIDALFSPYREDSAVSRLDRGEVTVGQCHPDVAEVLARCRETAAQTGGWFTAHPAGRLDPSGWVKGWAVDEVCRALCAAGSREHCVSGGGDVRTTGGPWRIGVANPLLPGTLAAVLTGTGLAVATSGTAERGAHIMDPFTGRPAVALASLTLVGDPGTGLARTDAWATAVFAMGPERGLAWAEQQAGIEALAVLPDGRRLRTGGLSRHLSAAGPADWTLRAPCPGTAGAPAGPPERAAVVSKSAAAADHRQVEDLGAAEGRANDDRARAAGGAASRPGNRA